jgi:hypothetical protein
MTRGAWSKGRCGWLGAVVGAALVGLAGYAAPSGQPAAAPPAGGASAVPASGSQPKPQPGQPAPGAPATAAPAIAIPPVPETLTFAYTSFAANQ